MKKHEVLGQTYQPGAHAVIYDAESKRDIKIEINALGFRDYQHQMGKSAKKRVLILGDSFAAGFSVEFDRLFSIACERYLNKHSRDQWEVITIGVAGFGTAQEMLAYETIGKKFYPDFIVLCFFAGNDVSDNSSELSTNPRVYFNIDSDGHLVQEPSSRLRRGLSSFLNENSRLYLWQKNQFHKLEYLYKTKVELNPADRIYLAAPDARIAHAWKITEALLARLQDDVAKERAHLLVAYIPGADEVYGDWWQESLRSSPLMGKQKWSLDGPEIRLGALTRRHGIDFASPKSAAAADDQHRWYFKHGHFNEYGHEKFGQFLAQKINNRSVIN